MTWWPTSDEWPSIRRMLLVLLTILAVTLALLSCGQVEPAPRPVPTPAEVQAAALRAVTPPAAEEVADLRRQEVAAGVGAAQAAATGDQVAADRQGALAAMLGRLRTAAEQRQREQQQELDRRIAAADQAARAERAAQDRRQQDQAQAEAARAVQAQRARWVLWSGIAIGGSVVLAGILLALRLPVLVAVGVPGSLAAGAITLASWLSVPWLPIALGCLLGLLILVGLVWLVRYLVAEWQRYADNLATAMPDARAAADTASRADQPRLIRWALDHLLGSQP